MEHKNKEDECCNYENYETFSIAVMLDNERSSYERWKETAKDIQEAAPNMPQVKDGIWTAEEAALFTLEDTLKAYYQETHPMQNNSVWSMLLNGALSRVNWREVAENILAE